MIKKKNLGEFLYVNNSFQIIYYFQRHSLFLSLSTCIYIYTPWKTRFIHLSFYPKVQSVNEKKI